MIRESPAWQVFVGLGMLVVGLMGACNELQGGSAAEDARSTRPARSLSAYRDTPQRAAPRPLQVGMGIVFAVCGAGLSLYAVRQIRREGALLRDGVPVIGHIVHIHHEHRRSSRLTYRFEDDDGMVREGVYYTLLTGGPLDSFAEGQEVTCLYDPADSSKHMLDVDNVRRADAAVRDL